MLEQAPANVRRARFAAGVVKSVAEPICAPSCFFARSAPALETCRAPQGTCKPRGTCIFQASAAAGIPWWRSRERGLRESSGSLDSDDSRDELRRAAWRIVTGADASDTLLRTHRFVQREPEMLLASGLALTTHLCTPAELAATPSYVENSALQKTIPRAAWLDSLGVDR